MSSGAAGGVGGGGVLPPAPMALGRKGHKGGGAGPGGYHPPKTPTGRILFNPLLFALPRPKGARPQVGNWLFTLVCYATR